MPILAGISGPLQDTDDAELIALSLDGFKQAIKIVCLFDLELERNAFVTTLAKFTFLNNFGEMKYKNVEAIKTLLNVAMVDGNYLKGSWREVLTCVSQLERFQLIAQGVDSQALPELGRKPFVSPFPPFLPSSALIFPPSAARRTAARPSRLASRTARRTRLLRRLGRNISTSPPT